MSRLAERDPFACSNREHRHCRDDALAAAEEACARAGARLTSTRRRVLELIWNSHRPLGAYALLEQLAADGRRPAPPTVYRALEFLLAQGLIHRIDSLNAFAGCTHPGESHRSLFLICRQCHCAQELPAGRIEEVIANEAGNCGFTLEKLTLEAVGLCHSCSRGPTPDS